MKQEDSVQSRNAQTGRTANKTVQRVTIRSVPETEQVTLADKPDGQTAETIVTTREHPFYVDGQGFVPAGKLCVGNAVVTRAGPALFVTSVTFAHPQGGTPVYNMTVADAHTYFVGTAHGGAWVHNINCVSVAKSNKRKHGGEVWGLKPKEGNFVDRAHPPFSGPKDEDGNFEWWEDHYVNVDNGMVRDPMMAGHNKPTPLEQWKNIGTIGICTHLRQCQIVI